MEYSLNLNEIETIVVSHLAEKYKWSNGNYYVQAKILLDNDKKTLKDVIITVERDENDN